MKYVFLDDNYGVAHILMRDLEVHPDCYVIYKDRTQNNCILSFILWVLLSVRIRKWVRIPFKRLWFRMLFRIRFNKGTKVIAMTAGWYHYDWIDYVKASYPNAKLVLLLRDTVQNKTEFNKEFKIEEAKQKFDLILSYDNVHDVPVYGLTYAPVYMSVMEELRSCSHACKYDIAWIADAKDRMEIVNRLYRRFMANGLKCYFYISHAKKSDKLPDRHIIYANHYIDRMEMLQKELESNCILEVLKGDASSNTLRFWEAVIYNKKLYTNWAGAVDSPYYDPRYMKVFNKPDEIDCDFIKEHIEVDYKYQGELSPVKLLDIFNQCFGAVSQQVRMRVSIR